MNIPPGFAQVNMRFEGPAHPRGAEITFGVTVGLSPPNPNSACISIHGLWETWIRPVISDAVTLVSTRIKYGPNETGAAGEYNDVVSGAVSTNSASPQEAILVRKITATGGRSGRGRLFHPGVPEAATDAGGRMSGAQTGNFQAAFEGWRAALGVASLPMVLLHNSIELQPLAVTSLEVDGLVATQRRRLRKVGGRRRTVGG